MAPLLIRFREDYTRTICFYGIFFERVHGRSELLYDCLISFWRQFRTSEQNFVNIEFSHLWKVSSLPSIGYTPHTILMIPQLLPSSAPTYMQRQTTIKGYFIVLVLLLDGDYFDFNRWNLSMPGQKMNALILFHSQCRFNYSGFESIAVGWLFCFTNVVDVLPAYISYPEIALTWYINAFFGIESHYCEYWPFSLVVVHLYS